MENKSRSVNYFEIVKIDVLKARDYADRVPDVQLFFIRQNFVDFRAFYENFKNLKNMHGF